jgi:hypothetical protein
MLESWTSGLRARRGEGRRGEAPPGGEPIQWEADGDTYAGRALFPWNGSTGAKTRGVGEGERSGARTGRRDADPDESSSTRLV